MPTYSPKPGDITHAWHVIDATDVVLGRLATQAATLLRGKHKPIYAPHMDTGDFVVIVNAEKVAVTRQQARRQVRLPPLRLPGRSAQALRRRDAREAARTGWSRRRSRACCRRTASGRAMGKKLKVYAGPEHPHAAQKPTAVRDPQVAQ